MSRKKHPILKTTASIAGLAVLSVELLNRIFFSWMAGKSSLEEDDGAYYHWKLPRPSGIEIKNKKSDFLLKNGNTYYLFCFDLPMRADANVALNEKGDFSDTFALTETIQTVIWMDNGEPLNFVQEGSEVTVYTEPFCYGRNLVVRVAKITC